jgi:hypothetical protein
MVTITSRNADDVDGNGITMHATAGDLPLTFEITNNAGVSTHEGVTNLMLFPTTRFADLTITTGTCSIGMGNLFTV